MRDLHQLHSLEDIAVARRQLQQRSSQQLSALQRDTNVLRREVSQVTSRLQRIIHTASSIASFFSPLSAVAPRISKGTFLVSIIKRLIRRFRKK
ncbi:MAG: hypothetical protein ACI4BD_01165 [Paludibacteraceae bacterium]